MSGYVGSRSFCWLVISRLWDGWLVEEQLVGHCLVVGGCSVGGKTIGKLLAGSLLVSEKAVVALVIDGQLIGRKTVS